MPTNEHIVPNGTTILGNGVADDRNGLNTLANTTMASTGGTITFQGQYTYRIGAGMTFPSNITLRLMEGARLKIDPSVTVTILGSIDAGAYQIFDTVDKLSYQPSTGGGTYPSAHTTTSRILLPGKTVYPEWWGAKSDSGTTDCTTPIRQACESLDNSSGVVELTASAGYYGIVSCIVLGGNEALVRGNLVIKGQGWNTRIKHSQKTTVPVGNDIGLITNNGFVHARTPYFSVRDLRLSGYDSDEDDRVEGIRIGYCQKVVIDSFYFDTMAMEGICSVNTTSVEEMWLTNCYAEKIGRGTGESQIVAAYNNNAERSFLVNCVAIDCGVGCEQTGRGFICTGNRFENISARGIQLHSTSFNSDECVVSGNTITNAPSGIICLDNQHPIGKCVISSNVICFCAQGINVGCVGGNGYLISENYLLGGNPNNAAIHLGPGRHTVRGNRIDRTYETAVGSIAVGTNKLDVNVAAGTTNSSTGVRTHMKVEIAGVTGVKTVVSEQWNLSAPSFYWLDSTANAAAINATVTYYSDQWAYGVYCQTDDYHLIEGNTFNGFAWTSAAVRAEGMKLTMKNNTFEDFDRPYPGYPPNLILVGTGGWWNVIDYTGAQDGSFVYSGRERSVVSLSAVPGSLSWKVGDVVNNNAPASAGYMGWVCTVAGTSGAPFAGTVTGAISSGSTTLTVNTAAGLYTGAYITIAGVTGKKRVSAIIGTTVTLDSVASATVSAAAVSYSPPTWKTFGLIS